MHKLISKEDAQVTRFVTLKNLETGTEDYCFDDSDMVDIGHKDFWFMEVGKKYDCKILLFGNTRPSTAGKKVLCRVVRDNIARGRAHHVEVKVGEDTYYVPRSNVENQLANGEFYYYYTRKDLVQVNNTIIQFTENISTNVPPPLRRRGFSLPAAVRAAAQTTISYIWAYISVWSIKTPEHFIFRSILSKFFDKINNILHL